MLKDEKEDAARWQQTALQTLATAKHLRDRDDCRSCVSRAYYAAYQAATSVCILHGDAVNFPQEWNNPAHEQLPRMIANNGSLTVPVRRAVKQHLISLRSARESADYRMGATIDTRTVLDALKWADHVFQLLEIKDGNN